MGRKFHVKQRRRDGVVQGYNINAQEPVKLHGYETESMRIGIVPDSEAKKIKTDDMLKVKYKGYEFGLDGFSVLMNKATNKPVFAWKFKHPEKRIMYYIFDEDQREYFMKFLEKVKTDIPDYSLEDAKEWFDKIIAEVPSVMQRKKQMDEGK